MEVAGSATRRRLKTGSRRQRCAMARDAGEGVGKGGDVPLCVLGGECLPHSPGFLAFVSACGEQSEGTCFGWRLVAL